MKINLNDSFEQYLLPMMKEAFPNVDDSYWYRKAWLVMSNEFGKLVEPVMVSQQEELNKLEDAT